MNQRKEELKQALGLPPTMNLGKALNRMKWRLTNGRYEPNNTDLEAFKFVYGWIDRQKELMAVSQEYELLAKLYIYCLKHEAWFYKDVQQGNIRLREITNKSFDELVKDLTDTLNLIELSRFLANNGQDLTIEQTKEQLERFKSDLKTEKKQEYKEYLKGIWKPENVFKSANNTITELINRYKKQ